MWCWVVHNLWFDLVWVFDLVIVLIAEVDGSLLKLNLFILGWRYAEISYYVDFIFWVSVCESVYWNV